MNIGRNLSLLSALTIAALSAQSADVPEWQKKAGANLTFDVASVKPAQQFIIPAFPLDSGNLKTPGGRFVSTFPLETYIDFAYKLELNPEQSRVIGQLPKWVTNRLFEIEAKAEGDPTKDQMRVMMQSLLADRFKLSAHYENREAAVFDLVLAEAGKRGPKLLPHSEGPPCADTYPGPTPSSLTGVFPSDCELVSRRSTPKGAMVGARNISMSRVATEIYREGFLAGDLDRAIIDKTGLNGMFDFSIDYAPDSGSTAARLQANSNTPSPDPEGTPFLTAVREQLGLRLVRSKGTIRILVIDHVEEPSAN